MYPVLIRIGGLEIRSYSVMLLLAFLLGIWIAEKRAKRKNIDTKVISDLVLWVIIGVVFGSRMFYVIMHWSEFREDLLEIFMIWHGGAVYFGGFLFALLLGLLYAFFKKLPIRKLLDIIAPSIALGEGIGRIGCFLNGCCFGKPSNVCGVIFKPYSPAGLQFPDTPLIPTQLFQSFFGFLLFIILLHIEKKKKLLPGQLFFLFLAFFGGFRLLINFFRYYEDTFNYLLNQIIAALVSLIGIVLYFAFSKKKLQK